MTEKMMITALNEAARRKAKQEGEEKPDETQELFIEVQSYDFGNNADVVATPNGVALTLVDDRSGSMTYEMERLKNITKAIPRQNLNEGDVIAGISYAGRGDVRDFIPPTPVANGMFERIDNLIDADLQARGGTSYLGPFQMYNDKVSPILRALYPDKKEIIAFLTDGGNTDVNVEEIFAEIEKTKENAQIYYIGLGRYYNREFILQMKEITGGSFIHADDVEQYGLTINDVTAARSANTNKLAIEQKGLTFILGEGDKNPIQISNSEEVDVPYDKFSVVSVFWAKPSDVSGKKTVYKNITAEMRTALYGASVVCSQNMRTKDAYTILARGTRDKKATETFVNARTVLEYGNVENYIKELIVNALNEDGEPLRYIGGEGIYKANKTAVTLLDVIRVLGEEKVLARIVNDYDATGLRRKYVNTNDSGVELPKPTEIEDFYPLTTDSLTFGDKKSGTFNIGWKINRRAILNVGDVPGAALVLAEETNGIKKAIQSIAVNQWRTYIFADSSSAGDRPVTHIEVKLSENALERLKEIGAIPKNSNKLQRILDLRRYPVSPMDFESERKINSSIYASLLVQRRIAEFRNTVIGYYLKPLEPQKEFEKQFNADQVEFLENNLKIMRDGSQRKDFVIHESLGVNKMPKGTELVSSDTDFNEYSAFNVDVNVTGSLLKASKFNSTKSLGGKTGETYITGLEKKVAGNKKLTVADFYIDKFLKEIGEGVDGIEANGDAAVIKYLTNQLSEGKQFINDCNFNIAHNNIRHIYSKEEFSGQTSRAFVQTVNLDNLVFEVKVKVDAIKNYYGEFTPAETE